MNQALRWRPNYAFRLRPDYGVRSDAVVGLQLATFGSIADESDSEFICRDMELLVGVEAIGATPGNESRCLPWGNQ
jgi:hypothetical protein